MHIQRRTPGIWIGLTVSFLLASIAMVQLRCKVTGGYPCGDWPRDGYTWHFLPPFLLLLLLWSLAAQALAVRTRQRWADMVSLLGETVSPMLGLILAWAWYGLTGPQFHPPKCTVPLLCHDVVRSGIVFWSLPWVIWGMYSLVGLWRGLLTQDAMRALEE